MSTSLSEADQKAIEFWTDYVGVPVFPALTRDKSLSERDWSKVDFSAINYKANLANGLYDNGIAIRTGKTSKDQYLIVLDFDGWDAVEAWFGSWDAVLEASRRTRIEWHNDKSRLHYFILATKPIPNRRIHIKDSLLEIRCERQAVFASPSIHKDGEQYSPINSKEISELRDTQLMGLQTQIDTLCKGYMSDEDKSKYDEYLHLPTTIIGEHQGRHDATKTIINHYYWKYSGEWLNYSDDQRFEKAWEWHLQHCNPPRSKEEFDRLCKWAKDTFRSDRDKLHEEWRTERETENKKSATADNNNNSGSLISYQINPHEYIETTIDNRLVEIKHTWSEDVSSGQIEKKEYIVKTFLACRPARIVKHRNPLSFLERPQRYTIEFRGSEPSGNFTLKQKTLPQIIAHLKETNVLTDRGLDIAIISMIKGFEKAEILEESDDIEYIGFLPISVAVANGSVGGGYAIVCSNIDVGIQEDIDTGELREALDFIDRLAEIPYKDRLDLLSHVLLFGLIATCSFIFKCIKAPTLEWSFFYGSPNSGKTTSCQIALSLDGHENDPDFNLNIKQVDTKPRMGDAVSKTTFPIVVDEMELVDKVNGNRELTDITGAIKSAIDQPIFRKVLDYNRNSEHIPALSPLMMTSNPSPPFHDAALMKRLTIRHFSVKETHLKQNNDAIAYDKEILSNLWKLHVIGRFRNQFIMNNQELILDKKLTPFEKARIILKAIYEYAYAAGESDNDNDRKVPQWFSLELKHPLLEESLSDAKQSVINAFETMIIDKMKSLKGIDSLNSSTGTYNKFTTLVTDGLLPFAKQMVSRAGHTPTDSFAFSSGIVTELYKYGVTNEQLPNLATFADFFEGTVQRSNGKRAARIKTDALLKILDAAVVEDLIVENNKNKQLEEFSR